MRFIIALLATCFVSVATWASGPVNINTATAEEIADSLKGVGESKAQLIVQYRDENGAFMHVDELVNVKGIGISTVDKNRGLILLNDSETGSEN
jgi:competence protein ComEA